ncbi:hypothetical protein RB195_019694 [Necator americanus]|uniref:Transposase Helix-turn-helix domain-containing protein n=1 Tax=Necator americanus TaxID=51031 RepID=A0ABR1CFC5_NECAM
MALEVRVGRLFHRRCRPFGTLQGVGSGLARRQMEADPYQTTCELTVALGVNQTTVVRGVKSIEKVLKLSRWVPHALTQYGMGRRATWHFHS